MFLRPQHFQQFERYIEHYIHLRATPTQGYGWGFCQMEIDRNALAIGKLAIIHAQGIMPDGTPFAFSSADEAPPALEVPSGLRDERVMLALPRARVGSEDVVFEDGESALARYHAREHEISDTSAATLGPALVQLGQLRLRLMPESEVGGEWMALGVARVIERRADNQVMLDGQYIPPWLAAGRQPLLNGFIEELHGLLDARSEVLASRLVQPGRSGVAEVADLLMLEVINRYLGSTWHARQFDSRHPEQLFHDWMKLACDLATYTTLERRPGVWPRYEHADMYPAFNQLMSELRRSLSTVLEQHAIQIPLHDRGQGVSTAQINDPHLLREAGFVLAVRADLPSEALRTRFPAQVKIGPVARIRDLVHLQLPGVPVHALPAAPRQIPYSAGHSYFELDKSGEFWKQLEQNGSLALHLAGEFPGLTMEFWAIRG
jgi:type VI secretion system protein ImpJ